MEHDGSECFSWTNSAMSKSYPHPNPSKSFWIEEGPDDLKNYRSTEALPLDADIVIIGSGYSGTSIASHLLWANEDNVNTGLEKQRILMLEARDFCSGATGRNGGHIRGEYQADHKSLVEKFGEEIAADIVTFEHNELLKVSKLIKDLNIDCNLDLRTACQTFDDPKTYEDGLNDYYAFMTNKFISQELKDMVNIYFHPQSNDVSEHKVGPFCYTVPTCSVWPYKLVTFLMKKCLEKGLNLQTYTTVKHLEKTDGMGWLVVTNRGTVNCKKVICATNAYTRAILPEFGTKIMPVKGVVSHIKPLKETPGKLKYNYYHTNPCEGDYVTAHKDMSMIAGGGGKTYMKYPNIMEMYNNTDDSFAPNATIEYFRDYAAKMYPDFAKDTDFINDYTWAGCMAYSNDDFPFIGELGKYGRPNLYLQAGFCGHGMPRIWSCSEYLANLINGVSENDNIKIPSCFKITTERMFHNKFNFLDAVEEYDPNNKGKFIV